MRFWALYIITFKDQQKHLFSEEQNTSSCSFLESLEKHFIDKGLANKIYLTKFLFMPQMNMLDTMEQHVNMFGAMAE